MIELMKKARETMSEIEQEVSHSPTDKKLCGRVSHDGKHGKGLKESMPDIGQDVGHFGHIPGLILS